MGLGNIWRFPSEAGANGGAAFVLIYIFFMVVIGLPCMISELAVGRYGGRNVSNSFYSMSGNKRAWGWMGIVPVVGGILILSYYSVVAGWTLEYLYEAVANKFAGKSSVQYSSSFAAFSTDVVRPIVCLFITLLITAGVVASGVQKGIERASKVMMPLLFVCLIVLAVCSITLPGAEKGIAFFLHPDFSKVTGSVVLSAMGQAFFSLSVGVLVLCTYGCYFRRDVNLVKESASVALLDTFVALMAGLVIFPAVFSVGSIAPDAGPALVFITLPNVFQQTFSAAGPAVAYIFSLVFYLLLLVAAITSMISMLEGAASIFIRKYKLRRPLVSFSLALLCGAAGACCSLSFGAWREVHILGMSIFDLFDFLVAKFIMPLCSLITCLFVGWVVDKKVLCGELTSGGLFQQPLYTSYRFIVRYIAPIGIAIIFCNELRLF